MTNRLIPLALIALTATLSLQPAGAAPLLAQTQPAAKPDRPAHRPEETAVIHGLAGPYLAARMAAIQNDYRSAADYYLQALAQDDTDGYLQDSALVALISSGEMERATALAVTMSDQGRATELARLVQRAELARAGRWDDLVKSIDAAPTGGDVADAPAARRWSTA